MKKRVLLIDDEEIFRVALRIALKRKRIELVGETDRSLENIIPALETGNFYNLLIIDMSMPSLSGLDILEYIIQEKVDIPVVILTDYMDHDLRFFCSNIKKIRIIQKPFDSGELIREIYELID